MYKYIKDYSGRLSRIKRRAQYVKVPFGFCLDDIKKLYEAEACFYCGEKFKRSRRDVDRFIPSIGYVPSNCVMSCTTCNTIKGSMTKGCDRIKRMQKIIDTINNLTV